MIWILSFSPVILSQILPLFIMSHSSLKQPLSNIQLELLKLYSTGVKDQYLSEIKEMIARYLLTKAKEEAGKVWLEKGYNEETMKEWLKGE
jgi:hypothetical protein